MLLPLLLSAFFLSSEVKSQGGKPEPLEPLYESSNPDLTWPPEGKTTKYCPYFSLCTCLFFCLLFLFLLLKSLNNEHNNIL